MHLVLQFEEPLFILITFIHVFFYLMLKPTRTQFLYVSHFKEASDKGLRGGFVKPRRTKERAYVVMDLFGLGLSLVKLAISLLSSRLFEMSSPSEPKASAIAVL